VLNLVCDCLIRFWSLRRQGTNSADETREGNIHAVFQQTASASADAALHHAVSKIETLPASVMKATAAASAIEFARCFLRLANLPNFATDRLSRYEATLWRQAVRILFALEVLDRRKPQERSCHHRISNQHESLACERHEY
jgi:hypothetical protein